MNTYNAVITGEVENLFSKDYMVHNKVTIIHFLQDCGLFKLTYSACYINMQLLEFIPIKYAEVIHW